MIAQRKIVPYTVPAFREETMSPAPTPVAAMIRPGPTILSRLLKVEGTSVLTSRSPVTSAIFALPKIAIETCLGTLDTKRSPDTTVSAATLDPAHQQGVAREKQDDLRDGDGGEGCEVRQAGGEVQHCPDAGGDDQREEKAGRVRADSAPHPARHQPAEGASYQVHGGHQGQLQR